MSVVRLTDGVSLNCANGASLWLVGNRLACSAKLGQKSISSAKKTAQVFKSKLSFCVCILFLVRRRQVFSAALLRCTDTVLAVSRPALAEEAAAGGTGKPVPYRDWQRL